MTVPNYPPNNQSEEIEKKTAPEDRKVERVTKGKVVRRRKKTTAFSQSVEKVGDYVFKDVVMPMLRDMVVDSVTGGIERAIYGDTRPARSSIRGSGARGGHISYNRYSSSTPSAPAAPARRTVTKAQRARHDFDNIIIDSRQEADEVIDKLFELMSSYGYATVSDLYSMVGIESVHTDTQWGWYSMPGASPRRIRAGYLLDLPAPEFLE